MGTLLMLTEREERSPSTVRYHLRGELTEVVHRMREIMERYHPLGYSTRIERLGPVSAYVPAEGRWECVVSRATSCD